jgi:CxxC-x17-CxxC domain-containing protein
MSRNRQSIVWEGPCSTCGRPARLTFVPRDEKTVLCSDCHHQRQGRKPSPGGARSKPQLPEGYLQLGYFDREGHLRKEILIDEARAVAEVLVQADLAAVKLQSLYNRVRILRDRLNQSGNFVALNSAIHSLLIDAVDSTGRGVTPNVFLQFVERNVERAAVDAASFKEGFVEHLRAVRAWYLLARNKSQYR